MVWRADLDQDVKEKIYYFFMQYGRTGSLEKIKAERAVLKGTSDGWGPFLASSNAQLLSTRQIELYKSKLKAETAGDKAGAEKVAAELKKLEEYMTVIGKSGY